VWAYQRFTAGKAPDASREGPEGGPIQWSANKRLEFPAAVILILAALVALRVAIFAAALIIEPWSVKPDRFIPAWSQILQAGVYAAFAGVMLYGGRGDRRAWALGVFILDVAGTLLQPFVTSVANPSLLTRLGLLLRTDAFQATFVWFFASAFPTRAVRPWLARAFFAGTAATFALGVVLVAADSFARMYQTTDSPLGAVLGELQRRSPGDTDWYFTLQFLSLVPLLLLVPAKLRESGPNDRRRFAWLVVGIAVGFAPLALDVLLLTMSPYYAAVSLEPPLLRIRGLLIILGFTAVPVAGIYAAFVQRVLDIRLVVRRALQYLLVRSVIRGLTVVPFTVLVIIVIVNREASVMSLVTGPTGLVLGSLTILGLAAMASHRRLLGALDHRFFRQQTDARATMLAMADAVRKSSSVDDVKEKVEQAVNQAFYPSTILMAAAGSDQRLHVLHTDLPSLPTSSALARILADTDLPLDFESADAGLVPRLPASERNWLQSVGAEIVVPLRGAGDALRGVLCLGEKRSELRYTDEDHRLLAAVGSAAGLALDRLFTEGHDASRTPEPQVDPPARECSECGIILDPEATVCWCGGRPQRSSAPRMISDRLRFDQRIGSGGMGVVYRAYDVRQQKTCAVKTLVDNDPVLVSRLRREARAMAAAQHDNLATIHGVEVWHGFPMVVMEYLEGGTLTERLRNGPLSIEDTLALGTQLAAALSVLHRTSLLHRDIKPSNIGFTGNGVPKLLDFGLVKVLPRLPSAMTETGLVSESAGTLSLSTETGEVRGTPAYLSPEVLSGTPPSTHDDLWGLAVTLLEACTAENPFQANTVAATVARVLGDRSCVTEVTVRLPDPMRRLFEELLGPAASRPQTADELSERLKMR
jgi:hypothetical protein